MATIHTARRSDTGGVVLNLRTQQAPQYRLKRYNLRLRAQETNVSCFLLTLLRQISAAILLPTATVTYNKSTAFTTNDSYSIQRAASPTTQIERKQNRIYNCVDNRLQRKMNKNLLCKLIWLRISRWNKSQTSIKLYFSSLFRNARQME